MTESEASKALSDLKAACDRTLNKVGSSSESEQDKAEQVALALGNALFVNRKVLVEASRTEALAKEQFGIQADQPTPDWDSYWIAESDDGVKMLGSHSSHQQAYAAAETQRQKDGKVYHVCEVLVGKCRLPNDNTDF